MKKKAQLWRMKTSQHICPYGLKSKDLLIKQGFEVEDHLLQTREQTEQFKAKHQVQTTPQTFIEGERVGGYDDLKSYFNVNPLALWQSPYCPVVAVFSMSFLSACALVWSVFGTLMTPTLVFWFIALSMVMLSVQKLRDLPAFSMQFITYDLLAMRWVGYSSVYPLLEGYAGLGMLAGFPALGVAPLSLFIGMVGAVSIIKAVYIDKRELKCACVGGRSQVPLGMVSLLENLIMCAAGVWMLLEAL